METNTRPDAETAFSDLSVDVGEAVPVTIDEEEPTLAIPAETNRQVVDGRLR